MYYITFKVIFHIICAVLFSEYTYVRRSNTKNGKTVVQSAALSIVLYKHIGALEPDSLARPWPYHLWHWN